MTHPCWVCGVELRGDAPEMYESWRERGPVGAKFPGPRRPGLATDKADPSRNLGQALSTSGAGRLSHTRCDVGIKRWCVRIIRKSATAGPDRDDRPGIRRPGLPVRWLGGSRNLEKPRRSSGPVAWRILGARARWGGVFESYESQR